MVERDFDRQLLRYRDTYKVIKGEDGVFIIPCKKGDIAPFSTSELCCYQSFRSGRGLNSLKSMLPVYVVITQEGETEIIFKFPENRLPEVALLVRAKQKRKLTDQQRLELRERFLKSADKKHSSAA